MNYQIVKTSNPILPKFFLDSEFLPDFLDSESSINYLAVSESNSSLGLAGVRLKNKFGIRYGVYYVGVDNSFRGLGVGTSLVSYSVESLTKVGLPFVISTFELPQFLSAQRIYRSLPYLFKIRLYGKRRFFFFSGGASASRVCIFILFYLAREIILSIKGKSSR